MVGEGRGGELIGRSRMKPVWYHRFGRPCVVCSFMCTCAHVRACVDAVYGSSESGFLCLAAIDLWDGMGMKGPGCGFFMDLGIRAQTWVGSFGTWNLVDPLCGKVGKQK